MSEADALLEGDLPSSPHRLQQATIYQRTGICRTFLRRLNPVPPTRSRHGGTRIPRTEACHHADGRGMRLFIAEPDDLLKVFRVLLLGSNKQRWLPVVAGLASLTEFSHDMGKICLTSMGGMLILAGLYG